MPSDEFVALVKEAKRLQRDLKDMQKQLDELAEKLASYSKKPDGEKPEKKGKSLLDSLLGDDE